MLGYRKDYIIFNKKGQFHNSTDKNLTLLQFTMEVSSALMKNAKPTPRKRGGRPPLKHWLIHRKDRLRFILCKSKTRLSCSECEEDICLAKDRNCFTNFHDLFDCWTWYFLSVADIDLI